MKRLTNKYRTLNPDEVIKFVNSENCFSPNLKYVVEKVFDGTMIRSVGVESLPNGRFRLTFYFEGDLTDLCNNLANSFNHPADIDLSFEYYDTGYWS